MMEKCSIGGPTGHLLEQNTQVFEQILQLYSLNDMPGIMKQMPPLPVKVNEELVNSILPRPTRPMQS
ncbi:hypothetical protein IFM89_034919 [Coptis chinensis]|uniref:Uncharacterized protein n=1 Tax=Coptis chinensis TaxID=261450 RepID=A0A835I6P8_9MAGN|nr:hypothetical protein IFM89_034919 [Coptis chinensis]